MTDSDRARWTRGWPMMAGAMAVLVAACGRSDQRKDGGPSADSASSARSGAVSPAQTRAALRMEADSNYTFGRPREPRSVDTMVIKSPGGVLPTIRILTATIQSTSERVPTTRLLARLHSDAPYPTMGIATGDNDVWRDSVAGGWRILMVPRDSTVPMSWQRLDTAVVRYFAEVATEPRLVRSDKGYGACTSGCDTGHCAMREKDRVYRDDDAPVRIRP